MQDAQLSDRGRSLKMPCDTRRVRELLTEGPCTPAEIAASLEMSQRDVACTVWVLTQQQAMLYSTRRRSLVWVHGGLV
jgi:hypothetical protein